MTPVLKISNLHKSFGVREVLKGIELAMAKGDVVSLIGSSGSSRLTLLRCVNLLEEFELGSIDIAGEKMISCPLRPHFWRQ
ncbi:ATP-binding cassette domain-containing protein [Mangrovicoccus sp. HB161399]|uniref:ATP-binding cassette domain-containing protein n=1 Tax=Mangrovicoccus sp. HB161399 TaxID=2720392 RepID=UPI001C130645